MGTFFEDWEDKTVQSGIPSGYSNPMDVASGSIAIIDDATDGKCLRVNSGGGNAQSHRRVITPDTLSTVTGDVEVTALIRQRAVVTGSNQYTPGPLCRMTATNAVNGMLQQASGGDKSQRVASHTEAAFNSIDSAALAWDLNQNYWIRLKATGTTFEMRTWAQGDTEPEAWQLSGVNTDTAAGVVGVGVIAGVTQETDPLIVAWGAGWDGDPAPLTAGTQLDVPTNFTFTAAAGVRQLDSSWTAVSGAGTYDWQVERSDDGSWVAFESGNTASTSFQLTDTDGVTWSKTYRGRVRAVPSA